MHIFVIDQRYALQKDSRFLSALKILRETAILGRATLPSRWNHLGLIAVEKHVLKVVLPLQNMSGLSLLSFNRAFDELEQMVNNNIEDCGTGQQKSRGSITLALQSSTKQYKELKGKKDKELVVVVLTTRWKGNVKQEVRNFCHESRETSISQIQILEMNDDEKTFFLSDKIKIHSLPTKGFEIAIESVCKEWLKKRPFELKLTFPNNGPQLSVQVEELFVDPHFSKNNLNDGIFPEELGNLVITSVASLTEMYSYYRSFGRCRLVSGNKGKLEDYHRWMALHQTARNEETVVIVQNEDQPLFTYALVPCEDSRMILQPIAREELELPVFNSFNLTATTPVFESAAKKLPLSYEYDLGSNANVLALVQRNWTKHNFLTDLANTEKSTAKPVQAKKGKTITPQKSQTTNSLAHPALGMY